MSSKMSPVWLSWWTAPAGGECIAGTVGGEQADRPHVDVIVKLGDGGYLNTLKKLLSLIHCFNILLGKYFGVDFC